VPTHRSIRRAAVLVAAGLAALVSTLVTAPAGQAASGGWGSGSWPYSNGVVCDSGGTSVPLVAWRLDGVASPAFLTTGISEVNGVDSGQPSIAANTPDPVLTPQTVGNLSQAQISAIAYLIATWGASASPARVAEVSELVAELAGTPLGADCLAAGTGATSTAEEQSMRTQALQLAGPYTVKLTSPATVAVSAAPIAVAANVTSALGYPVAGIAVQFAGTNVSQPVTATTDASGNASAHLTAVAVGSAPITVTATVAAPIGLRVRMSGQSTPAVYLAAPVTSAAGSLSLPLAQPRNVTVAVTTSAKLALAGSVISTTVTPTGLNGHAANAAVTVLGPLGAAPDGSCAALTAAEWTTAQNGADAAGKSLTLAQATVALVGNTAAVGPSFTVASAGCYASMATLTTTDAQPNVTAQSAFAAPASGVDVVATTLQVLTAPGQVALTGVLPAQVVVSGGPASTGSVSGELRGPIAPTSGTCPATGWDKAPVRAALARTALAATGTTTLALPDLEVAGCYAVGLTTVLTVGGLGSITVASPAGAQGTVALVLAPTMHTAATTTWIDTNTPEQATIAVYGTLTQPGTLTTTMLWLPSQPLGCASADWRDATVVGAGLTTPTTGDGSYPVTSAATPKAGCYSLLATLTLSANPSATIASEPGTPSSLVLAISPPHAIALSDEDGLPGDRPQVIFAIVGFVIALGAAAATTPLLGRRNRFLDELSRRSGFPDALGH
jgi:hypothetical protein